MAATHPLAPAIDAAITAWLQFDDDAPPLAPAAIGLCVERIQDVSPALLPGVGV